VKDNVVALPQKPKSKPFKKSAKATKSTSRIALGQKRLEIVAKVAKRKRKDLDANVARLSDFRSGSKLKRYSLIATASAFALLFALIAAAVFSPLLAVEKVLVRGNHLVSSKELERTLVSQVGKPLPQISVTEIASLLKKYKLIESFSVQNAPPHTLIVRVVERTPIAIVFQGGQFYYYDPAGVQIGKASNTDHLPVLSISGSPATSPTYATAIGVLLALPSQMLGKIALIEAKSTDNVAFRLRGYSGQRVIWGDKSNAALKAKVLTALIANQGKNDRVTYDVSSPTAPTVRY
jgi:cell division protein FtsQ